MRKIFIVCLLAILPIVMLGKKKDNMTPDFAYPQQVMKDADVMLEKALKEGDGTKVVTALIQSGLAQTSISPDSLPTVIKRVEMVANEEENAITRSLLDLLTADIYSQYYQNKSYDLNRRTALAMAGNDITVWSGKEFRDTITAIYERVLSRADVLRNAKLSDYSSVIEIGNDVLKFYPTLFDFASLQAVSTLREIAAERVQALSPIFLTTLRLRLPNVLARPSQAAINIADGWVAANEGAPKVAALLQRYELLEDYVVDDEAKAEEDTPLMRLYRENMSTPYAVELLLHENVTGLSGKNKTQLYNMLSDFEKKYPGYFRVNAVKNRLSELSQKQLSLRYPSQVARGKESLMEATMTNMDSAELIIYKVKPTALKMSEDSYKMRDCESTPVATIPLTTTGTVPFVSEVKVPFSLEAYGVYVIATSLNNVGNDDYYPALYCSDISLATLRGDKEMKVYVVDGIGCAPMKGAEVATYNDTRDGLKLLMNSKTDDNGSVTVTPGNNRNIVIKGTMGDDRNSPTMSQYLYQSSRPSKNRLGFVRPSLAIYHPGDTLEYVAVVYECEGEKRELCANTKICVNFLNPNYVQVNSDSVVTDSFGRIKGSFPIPEEGLTGEFILQLCDGKQKSPFTATRVMVSDYKLPTYEASVDSVKVDNADESVTIYGNAQTYSGFPVQSATIEAALEGLQRSWWSQHAVKFHSGTLQTDAEGNFQWTLTKELLAESPYAGGCYRAAFVVTSAAGETHSCQRTFNVSDAFSISTDVTLIKVSKDTKVGVSVVNALGEPVEAIVRLEFDNEGNNYEFETTARNGYAVVDLTTLPSASYMLRVSTQDVEAEQVEVPVVVYNPTDKASPLSKGIFIPETTIKADAHTRRAEVVYGVASADTYLLATSYHNNFIIASQWINPKKGMNKIIFELPDSINEMTVNMMSIRDFEKSAEDIKIVIDDPDDTLKVSVEHLRDKLMPLSQETVTVKVTNGVGRGKSAAVILDMYSKALDNLARQSWDFVPYKPYMPIVSIGDNLLGRRNLRDYIPYKNLPVEQLNQPEFNYYGMSWRGRWYQSEMMLMRSATPVMGVNRSYKAAKIEGTSAEMVAEESMEDKYVGAAGADNGSAEVSATPTEEYRPSEVPLAFFAPMLTTDAEGNVTYSFTVPNANTTWVLNALAYSDMLATGLDVREVIASKPVMVEPNLPRFLRTGDEATIRATVMNASGASAEVATEMEIADYATGRVISMQSVVCNVESQSAATVEFSIEAPATEGVLLVTVRSTSANYTDGVRTILPILASSQPVVDATTFYLGPDDKNYTDSITSVSGSELTLSFCENPTWEVVSALPGLRSADATTSIALSAQIFAAAVSGQVLSLNPAIEPALKEWINTANEEGKSLSMLNNNEELKQLVLASTPWVQQAESDEQRIARLALLFDSKGIDNSMKMAVKQLKKLQRNDGGWSWTSNYENSSLWATLLILNNFAELRQLGCYPSQLDDMVKAAVRYVDDEVAKQYARYPKDNYLFYSYIRSLYPEITNNTGGTKAYNATVQKVLKQWKKDAVSTKAVDALLLYRSGYKAAAVTILNSIREFATTTPRLGMWWDSMEGSNVLSLNKVGATAFMLETFNAIQPGCAEVDKIRQWLIINKIAQNWGSSVDAAACVSAILQSGSSWLSRPGDATIAIDGKTLLANKVDKLTGQLIANIPDVNGQLTINRTADNPAWGAVVRRSTQVMRDIKAHSLRELSITKEIMTETESGWQQIGTIEVGQVVKVRLVISTQRDMDYVTIVDNRAATFEPVIQTPRPVYCDGIVFYLENRDSATNLFINRLPKGKYVIEYELNTNNAGVYSSGIATIQSQYAPELTAHSGGMSITVE